MGKIKKTGVCAGIVVGGLIGGTVSMIGKMADKNIIDQLGENIMDSTILTGEIVGEMASGATHVVAGTVKKEPQKVKKGKKELETAGGLVVENVITNVKNVAEQSGEILEGVKAKDKQRVAKGLRTLVKMAAVGILTVGAIKVDEIADRKATAQLDERKVDEGAPKNGKRDKEKPDCYGTAGPATEAEKAVAHAVVTSTGDISGGGDPIRSGNGDREEGDSGGFGKAKYTKKDADLEPDGDGCFERKPSLEEELEKKIRF